MSNTEDEIRRALTEAHHGAEIAARKHKAAAGEKLLEARSQLDAKQFYAWCKRNLKLSRDQADACIDAAYLVRRMNNIPIDEEPWQGDA